MKITTLALWVGLVGLGAFPLRAAQASDFKTHYELAMALYQAQKFDEAVPEFKAAYEREAKPGLLFNIAQCYRKAGHPREAVDYYDRYLSSEPRMDTDTRRKVDGYLAEARNTLAALELEMKQRLAEEKAAREREPQPAPAPVAAAAPSQPALLPVVPSEPVAATSTPDRQTRSTPLYQRWWFWTAIGGGVAAAAVITGVAVGTRSTSYPSVPSGVPRVVVKF